MKDVFPDIEGLGEFLYSLTTISENLLEGVHSWENKLEINIYKGYSKLPNQSHLYIRIWKDLAEYRTYYQDMVYCTKDCFVIRDLENLFVQKIIEHKDEIEVRIRYTLEGKTASEVIKISNKGQIVSSSMLTVEKLPEPYALAMFHLDLDIRSISYNRNLYDIAESVEEELDQSPLDIYYDFECECGFAGTRDSSYSFVVQKVRPLFLASYHYWINTGTIASNIRGTLCQRYFIAYTIDGILHFYLSPPANCFLAMKNSVKDNDNHYRFKIEYQKFSIKSQKYNLDSVIHLLIDEKGIHEVEEEE